MGEHLLLALGAYGDNVITLRLLQQLRPSAGVRVLGTRLTREVADLLDFDAAPLDCLPTTNVAFYDLKAAGPWRALQDFLAVRRAIRSLAGPATTLLFDNQRKFRTHRLLAGGHRYEQPAWGRSAYADRVAMLERAFGQRLVLPALPRPPARVARVLVAPDARQAFRAFLPQVLRSALAYFSARGAETCLVDPVGRFAWARTLASRHLSGRPLADAVAELRRSDLVVTADSLSLHLAHGFGVAAIALVPERIARSFYFAPPGLLEQRQYLTFAGAARPEGLDDVLAPRLPERSGPPPRT